MHGRLGDGEYLNYFNLINNLIKLIHLFVRVSIPSSQNTAQHQVSAQKVVFVTIINLFFSYD